MREFLTSIIDKKYFILLLSSVFYILGLIGFFTTIIPIATCLLVLAIFLVAKNHISPKLVLFWYLMFAFGFFNASYKIKSADPLSIMAPLNATLTGKIASIPTTGANSKTKFFFEVNNVNGQKIKAKTLVTLNGKDFSQLNIADEYKIAGKLRKPFDATNPSQFDYGKYLQNFNTFSVFYANYEDCQELGTAKKWELLRWLNNLRNDIIATHSNYLKSPNLEILGGIVFGDDAIAPPDSIKTSFTNSGLLHILAASGMNVALIFGIWFFILTKLRAPYSLTILSGILIVLFYSLMTGLGASVVRATFMLVFILIGKLIDRQAHSISLLAFVALLMLIYNPAYINNVSFQLSFVVTFGLLISAPIAAQKLTKLPHWLSGAIFVPIIAQLWVAPIQMYYFNSFSTYSVLANMSILPFLTIISFGGFLSAVLAILKPIANTVCFVFDIILNPTIFALVTISNFFSNLPNSLLSTIQPNIFQIVLYYILLLLITLAFKFGLNKKMLVTILLTLFTLLIFSIPLKNNALEIIAFDVQNADAFLIKTPQNKFFIIDTAKSGYMGANSQAKFIILKYLKDRGIKNIDTLIITHFDNDHSGGTIDLLNNLNIKNVYINSLNDTSLESQKIYTKLKTHPNTKIAQNNQVIFEEPDFKIKTFKASFNNSDNENSIITLLSYKKFDGLFMGDAGIAAYEQIKNDLPQNIELLKIGHHGAKNVVSAKMLQHLNPKVALISTGPNSFGHPHKSTLDILAQNKIKIFRLDIDNSVKIAFDDNLKIYSFAKNKFVLKYHVE